VVVGLEGEVGDRGDVVLDAEVGLLLVDVFLWAGRITYIDAPEFLH